jgi:hypothetical protein
MEANVTHVLFGSWFGGFRKSGGANRLVRANLKGGASMIYLVGVTCMVCMVYLVYAILHPERF